MPLIAGWRWPVLAVLASLVMLGAAHAFERFAYLAPCPLCLRQREVYWALIAMVLVGLALWCWRPTRRFLTALNALIGMVFVTGAGLAFYHMGVEYGWFPAPSGCTAALEASQAANVALEGDLLASLDERMATVGCTEAAWHFLGLSMAAWNGIISAGLALLSFLAARTTARQTGSYNTR